MAEAIEVHRLAIDEFGGLHGIRDKTFLESAIFRPQNGYYQDIFEEAAALMASLAQSKPFVDGNKRVCILLTDIMLRANGWFLDIDPDAAQAFIAGFATPKEDRFSRIVEWIKFFATRIAD